MDLYADASGLGRLLTFLEEQGVDLRHPDVWRYVALNKSLSSSAKIPAQYTFELLEIGSSLTGRNDLGLLCGQWMNLSGFATISLMWQQARSIAQWYELMQRYIHVETNAVSYGQRRHGRLVDLIHEPSPMMAAKSRLAMQITTVLTTRVFRAQISPDWTPVRLHLVQSDPDDDASFREFFRCPIRFGEKQNLVVVRAADFDRELETHNPELMAFLSSYMRDLEQQSALELEDLVAQTILRELSLGRASVTNVAATLGTSSRSLQRRLKQKGTGFSDILKSVRMNILEAHQAQHGNSHQKKLALELGFSDASAANRFIRSVSGR